MAQQTAVDFFIEQLSLNVDITEFHESEDILSSINKLHNLIDYAKQLEKEQIMKAYKDYHDLGHIYGLDTEQYYKETYGSNNKI